MLRSCSICLGHDIATLSNFGGPSDLLHQASSPFLTLFYKPGESHNHQQPPATMFASARHVFRNNNLNFIFTSPSPTTHVAIRCLRAKLTRSFASKPKVTVTSTLITIPPTTTLFFDSTVLKSLTLVPSQYKVASSCNHFYHNHDRRWTFS